MRFRPILPTLSQTNERSMGLDFAMGKLAITAIAKGEIPNVSIKY